MKIGFVGAGKMARALAVGLLKNPPQPHADFEYTISTLTEESNRSFRLACADYSLASFHWTSDNREVVRRHDFIVLGLKPQQMFKVVPSLAPVAAGKLFLSVAAGIPIAKLQHWLGSEARVVRAMPNLPILVGAGASVFAGGDNVSALDYSHVHSLLSSGGKAWHVQESQIDTITALSGSGPAYVFHFIEAMIRGGEALGLPTELARDLALQTVWGSAKMAAESEMTPLEIAAEVKSPGGTTEAGCSVLDEGDILNDLVLRSMESAKGRAVELAGTGTS